MPWLIYGISLMLITELLRSAVGSVVECATGDRGYPGWSLSSEALCCNIEQVTSALYWFDKRKCTDLTEKSVDWGVKH